MKLSLILLASSFMPVYLNAADTIPEPRFRYREFEKFVPANLNATNTISEKSVDKEYSFVIQDSPSALFTMRQSNESFLSIYRLGVNEINRNLPRMTGLCLQAILDGFFFMPLIHEEGHRSILTNEEIGAISKPYFNKHLAAYVTGVTNETLITLRNNNLPVFTRMYTAGLESDYALLLREKSLLSWKDESYDILWLEYIMRKFNLVYYYTTGLYNYNIGLEEERQIFFQFWLRILYGSFRRFYR